MNPNTNEKRSIDEESFASKRPRISGVEEEIEEFAENCIDHFKSIVEKKFHAQIQKNLNRITLLDSVDNKDYEVSIKKQLSAYGMALVGEEHIISESLHNTPLSLTSDLEGDDETKSDQITKKIAQKIVPTNNALIELKTFDSVEGLKTKEQNRSKIIEVSSYDYTVDDPEGIPSNQCGMSRDSPLSSSDNGILPSQHLSDEGIPQTQPKNNENSELSEHNNSFANSDVALEAGGDVGDDETVYTNFNRDGLSDFAPFPPRPTTPISHHDLQEFHKIQYEMKRNDCNDLHKNPKEYYFSCGYLSSKKFSLRCSQNFRGNRNGLVPRWTSHKENHKDIPVRFHFSTQSSTSLISHSTA